MRVYLAGGINGLSDEEANGWRTVAKQARPDIEWVDPMDRDYRGVEDTNTKALVEQDKLDVVDSDLVLLNALRPSWGTAMEFMFAWERVIPVWAWVDLSPSPWVAYHAERTSRSLRALCVLLPR